MRDTIRTRFWLMAGMALGAAALRLLPHPPNFTPVGALALFAGAHFDRKRWAFFVPLAAMLCSDAALEVLTGRGFTSAMPAIYGCFMATVGVGFLLRGRRTAVLPVAGAALASAVLFFIVTNFAVWAGGHLYAKTLSGLVACYVAAIPFFGPTLAGDLFYSAVLFGGFAWAENRFARLRPAVTA